MATKVTKSEIKRIIKEALREELAFSESHYKESFDNGERAMDFENRINSARTIQELDEIKAAIKANPILDADDEYNLRFTMLAKYRELTTKNKPTENSRLSNINEAYMAYSFDFEAEVSYYGTIYCARELVYSMVYDSRTATRLYNSAIKEGDWNEDELSALGDLIGDALEGANYHEEAFTYARSYNIFPYWKSDKASVNDKTKIDALIASCQAIADKCRLLREAISAALYSY